MKKFIVEQKEVHIAKYEVEAESLEEAEAFYLQTKAPPTDNTIQHITSWYEYDLKDDYVIYEDDI